MKLLLYCPKSKPYLLKNPNWIVRMGKEKYIISKDNQYLDNITLNDKIVAECDYEIKDLKYSEELLKNSCLTASEIFNYIKNSNTAYETHIKNLHIFDGPRELSEFYNNGQEISYLNSVWENYSMPDYDEYEEIQIKKAPQNMMYCYDCNGEKKIIISIRPEWLCKILNGEKTIEVRKKVLKRMLENDK